ncbi:MAG: transcriptional repressor [Sulfurimonas sp.]
MNPKEQNERVLRYENRRDHRRKKFKTYNDKKRYYEIQKNPHAHFICNECNTIECLKDVQTPKIEGYQIVDTVFKGLCKECNAMKEK